MNLTGRTLLFLSADHFQAYAWNGGKLSEAHCFTNDSDGREQFSDYLQHHRAPAYLLVDVIEEDFRQESVPHLIGPNRRDLIERKFGQYYRNTLFRQAKVLHRQTWGRRDDEMLFSALTNPQRISPWLDTLLTNSIPLIGIHSLPNISTPLLKNIDSDHVLLLSWEKHAGLRQTYFNKKRLHFSRLTPVNGGNTPFSASVATETPRTRQYLKSLSLPPPGEVLDVYIICHSDDKQVLQAHLKSDPGLRYSYLDIQTLGNGISAKNTYQDSDATQLFLHLLAANPPVSNYASPMHTHYYLLWQLRWILYVLAAVITLIGALWGGISFWQGRDYASETAPLLAQAAQLTRSAEDTQRRFPATTIPAADMKTAVSLMRKFDNYFSPPEEILLGLSDVLDKFTRIRPGKIAWQTSAADAAPSSYPAQVILFDGELLDFGSDYRSALTYLDGFQQALQQHGYAVSAEKMPLDISPKGSVSGDMQSPEKSAQFTLKLVWRHTG
ncbi:MAG: hypothetical protein EPO42_12360 [Gallionellaceae bacterium]|nr:MAG: hypothetical protein EPO42_12360 [Gallionellaceae bacterium]